MSSTYETFVAYMIYSNWLLNFQINIFAVVDLMNAMNDKNKLKSF